MNRDPFFGSTPPHSEPAERACLAALMLASEWIGRTSLRVEDFWSHDHQTIFQAILDVYARDGGESIAVLELSAHLEAQQKLASVGGLPMLTGLDLDLPDLGSFHKYEGIVMRLSAVRTLIHSAGEVAWRLVSGDLVDKPGRPAALEACERLESLVQRVGARLETKPPARIGAAVDDVLEAAMAQANRGDKMVGIRTGLAELDKHTLGLAAGELVTLAASPGVGKTAFALNIAAFCAIHEQKPAAVVSLEMDDTQLARRILANESNVGHDAIRSGSLSRADWEELVNTHRRLAQSPLLLRHPEENSLSRLTVDVRSIAARQEHGISLLVVDYLQLLSAGNGRNRNLEIATITRALKRLAGELECPVLLLSQLSRDHAKANRPPDLPDLRDSNAIEADSDKVWFLFRERTETPPVPGEPLDVDLLCRKDRHGPSGHDIALTFHGRYLRFVPRSLSRGPAF